MSKIFKSGLLTTLLLIISTVQAEIVTVTPSVFLGTDSADTEVEIFLEVDDFTKIDQVMVEIRSPSGESQFEDLERVTGNRFKITYNGFNECGQYRIFYTVNYKDGDISPFKSSDVYNCGSNPPTSFRLKSPTDGNEPTSLITFSWEASSVPDGKKMTYTLLIAEDEKFKTIVHRQEKLTSTIAIVGEDPDLKALEPYYWQVEAINETDGAKTISTDYRSFTINNPGALPGCVDMRVIDAVSRNPVSNVSFEFKPSRSNFLEKDVSAPTQGRYIRCASPGPYTIIMRALGYIFTSWKWTSNANSINDGSTGETKDEGSKIIAMTPETPETPNCYQTNTCHLINLSTRAPIQGEKYNVVAGFVIGGTGMLKVFLKGIAMEPGVDPKLCLHKHPSNELMVCNDDWQKGENANEIAQLPEHMRVDLDAGLLLELPAGGYTVILSSVGVQGIGRVGINTIDSSNQTSSAKLINLSTRAPIEGGVGNIIPGFVITGTGTLPVFIKGIGMEPQGVDTKLCLYEFPSNELVRCNDNWQDGTNANNIANLPNHGLTEMDAGLWLNLPVGAYTVILSSKDTDTKVLGRVGINVIN